MIALVFVLLVLASVLGPSFLDYVQARKAERRRLEEWTADMRRLQDEELEAWRRRREQTRELTSRKVA